MMVRRVSLAVVAVFVAGLVVAPSARAQAKASTLDTAKAKAFVGDWVLTVEGRRGPQERPLTIRDVDGKVGAELGGGRGGPVTVTDITMPNASDLVLKWNQQGRQGEMAIVMTLTLKDGGLVVKQDFGGMFTGTGTGKKKM